MPGPFSLPVRPACTGRWLLSLTCAFPERALRSRRLVLDVGKRLRGDLIRPDKIRLTDLVIHSWQNCWRTPAATRRRRSHYWIFEVWTPQFQWALQTHSIPGSPLGGHRHDYVTSWVWFRLWAWQLTCFLHYSLFWNCLLHYLHVWVFMSAGLWNLFNLGEQVLLSSFGNIIICGYICWRLCEHCIYAELPTLSQGFFNPN